MKRLSVLILFLSALLAPAASFAATQTLTDGDNVPATGGTTNVVFDLLLLGLVVYFSYGLNHSVIHKPHPKS